MIKVELAEDLEKREALRAIFHKVFVEELSISKERVFQDEEASIHVIGKKEGIPVAGGRYRIEGPFLKIERVATLPEARGKGVATEVMLFLQALGGEQYPEYLQIVHAQQEALLFYKKLGWIPIGPPFEEIGVSHLLMIHPPQSKETRRALKCLQDPTCPQAIRQAVLYT